MSCNQLQASGVARAGVSAGLERYVDGFSVLHHCSAAHGGMMDFRETPVGPEMTFSFDKAFFFVLTSGNAKVGAVDSAPAGFLGAMTVISR
ncbi:MAG TPA: hypothetical protein ENG79_10590 [Desulfobacteraceae bacterium]|nr:hypothetical protein [Desulfobacteraceae bacterium]